MLLANFALVLASSAQLLDTKIAFSSDRDGNMKIYTVNPNERLTCRRFDNAILKYIEADSSAAQWEARGVSKDSLTLADGHLVVLGDQGKLALVEATPSGYKEKSSVQILDSKCWTVPMLVGGKLYLQNHKEMLCLDVAGP